jgi:ketosteroid isomerase-like protein
VAAPGIADLTREAFARWNAREFDQLLELFHEDAVWDITPVGIPDMQRYEGHAGLRRFFADWLATFPDSTIEVEEVEVCGDWGLATVLQRVSGASSGAAVPFRYFGIGRWRDGRLEFVENHLDERLGHAAFERYSS